MCVWDEAWDDCCTSLAGLSQLVDDVWVGRRGRSLVWVGPGGNWFFRHGDDVVLDATVRSVTTICQ